MNQHNALERKRLIKQANQQLDKIESLLKGVFEPMKRASKKAA